MIKLLQQQVPGKFSEYANHILDGGYVFDSENQSQINNCLEIFLDNKTGLTIAGNPGSGKTLFFEILQKILHPTDSRMFIKINVLDVVLMFNNKEVGHNVFKKWNNKNVLFDDLGTEDKGVLFGEKVEVFEKFIQFRYDLFRLYKFKTHFTTNLSKEQLNQKYGLRCISRLDEMSERVLLGNIPKYTDRRKYRNFKGFENVYHEIIKSKDDLAWDEKYEAAKKAAKENPIIYESGGLGSRARKRLGN